MFERVYLAGALAFLTLKAVTLLVNAASFPRLRSCPDQTTSDRISILVPARNEAENLRHTLPGLMTQGAFEVLLLDDQSQDQTAQVALQLGATVLKGHALPYGWLGKSWACWQLAAQARGDVLVFTDADVRWHEGALRAVHDTLMRHRADLLTVLPRPEGLTVGARLLTPLVDAVVLSYLPYPLLQSALPLATTANGQVMAFRRSAYLASGGHAKVRGDMLEDTQLARHLKATGGRVVQALGQDWIGVRMYGSYPDSVQGFGKNAVGVHLESRGLLVMLGLWHLMVYTVPWLLLLGGWGWTVVRVVGVLERTVVNVITGRKGPGDLAEGLLGPLTPLFALPAYVMALQPTVSWKGRQYRQQPARLKPFLRVGIHSKEQR